MLFSKKKGWMVAVAVFGRVLAIILCDEVFLYLTGYPSVLHDFATCVRCPVVLVKRGDFSTVNSVKFDWKITSF